LLTLRCHSFFEQLPRIARETFVPNDMDILRVRIRTTAAVDTDFDYGGLHFRYAFFFTKLVL
jgi:hypothetical protein